MVSRDDADSIEQVETVLWTIFGFTALVALLVSLAVVLAIRAARRANRVVPEVASQAPLAWQASFRHHARLHRQLQATVSAVRAAQRSSTTELDLKPLVAELESHACTLDDQLAVAARAPTGQRVILLRELDEECQALSDAGRRIIALSTQATTGRSSLQLVSERLDALDAALAELGTERAPGRHPSSS